MVNSKYITTRYLEDIRGDPNWDASTMQKRISRECGADVHISERYRAKARANVIIAGDVKAQYRRLYDYAETVTETNPGSLVKFKTSMMVEKESENE